MELIALRSGRGHTEEILDEFESALAGFGSVDLADYLPSPGDASYRIVLRELIRIDLDFRWRKRRRPIPLAGYRHRFPEAFMDAKDRAAIAYEEYRLRVLAGDHPTREDYEKAWDIAAADWPAPDAASGLGRSALPDTRLIEPGIPDPEQTIPKSPAPADPQGTPPEEHAQPSFPEVGEEFLGFRLLRRLGAGAFGCVYLAEQAALANRPVAVKISADSGSESQRLAQLQHANIVPIYSTHRTGNLQAVCMPYYGATTLADVIQLNAKGAALPTSGRELVSTLHARRSTAPASDAPAVLPRGNADPEPSAPAVPEFGSTVFLDKLASLNYVQAVLWLAERIADGLAHAHERGIWHCDLKPANILLTDEGQPMVLDFNLSLDVKKRLGPKVVRGGTIAYMAPEHLKALADHEGSIDGRSDLYSLGLIVYQLLAGQHPSPPPIGQPVSETIRYTRGRRHVRPQSLRRLNPAVTPAAEAIVRRCLEPDPDRRYAGARQLQEDIQRHLADLPLRHTPEPSWRERAGKWMRRHPRLASSGSVAALAAFVVCGLAATWALSSRHLRQLEADATLRRFRKDAGEARFLLTHVNEQAYRERGLAQCRDALDRYQILDNRRWRELPAVQALPAEQQHQLTSELGEMLLMYTSASLPPATTADDNNRGEIQAALDRNELAGDCFAAQQRPRAWSLQRAALLEQLGQTDDARRLRTLAQEQPLRTAQDFYLLAKEQFHAGQYREALAALHKVTDLDPDNFWAVFLQARCYDLFGDNRAAVAAYRTCIALQPSQYGPWFNRGLAHLRLKEYRRAVADFERAEKLRGDQPELFFNRALAHLALQQREQALSDLNHAEELGCSLTRVYFVRSRVREQLGDQEGARRDRDEGLRREPNDDLSWSARGFARLASDPKGALHDFDMALRLNPRSLPALENKAHVLAEILHRTEEAVAALDQAVQQYPDHVPARASRGVLLARLGKRGAAHQDAEEALLRDADAPTKYQVAGIYALTSRQQPEDTGRALTLLASALRSGYGVDYLDNDPDLEPVRDTPEFRRLAQGAKALVLKQK